MKVELINPSPNPSWSTTSKELSLHSAFLGSQGTQASLQTRSECLPATHIWHCWSACRDMGQICSIPVGLCGTNKTLWGCHTCLPKPQRVIEMNIVHPWRINYCVSELQVIVCSCFKGKKGAHGFLCEFLEWLAEEPLLLAVISAGNPMAAVVQLQKHNSK